ncbi:MAG: EamA family transporter [Planctomycetota bacterium]|jgi:drug/metabolite transporter (DMT)-like permease
MSSSAKPSWWAITLALLTLYIVWGSTYLAIRVGVETIPPFLMGGLRFWIAGVIVLSILAVQGKCRFSRKQCIDNAIGGFFMLLGGNGLVSWAEETISSGMATLVISLNPVFFVLAEWIIATWGKGRRHSAGLGTRPNALTIVGLLIGFLGLLILVGPSPWQQGDQSLDLLRVSALVMACVNWTIGSLYIRYATDPAEPFAGAGLQMVFGAVWMLIASALLGELSSFHWNQVSRASWWSLLYLIIAGSLIGYTSFAWLMKHASPTLVSTYGYINPIVAVFLGWWILNESVGPRILLASATIIGGVALISLSKRRSGKEEPVIPPTEDTEVDLEHGV